MGKSVFLGQLEAELERQPGTRVVLLDVPPPALTVEACLGALGVFIFRDVLGSSFLSRALHLQLRPLARADAKTLTSPFAERGRTPSTEVLDALFLASGGRRAGRA